MKFLTLKATPVSAGSIEMAIGIFLLGYSPTTFQSGPEILPLDCIDHFNRTIHH